MDVVHSGCLHSGRPGQAAEILGPLLAGFRTGHNRLMILRVAVLHALALLTNHELAQADDVFRFAVAKASRAGLPQPIPDIGADAGILLCRFLQNAAKTGMADGEICFAEEVMASWRAAHKRMGVPLQPSGTQGRLTSGEQRILELIAVGQSNKEIARTLGITAETVKSHIKHIFVKLGVDRRAQAVLRVRELGYVAGGARRAATARGR